MADDGLAGGTADGHPSGVPVPRPGLGGGVAAGALRDVLLRSRELGFLGPGDVEAHIRNADVFLEALSSRAGGATASGSAPDAPAAGDVGPPSSSPGPARLLDLGSGGGVPGLVIAAARDDLQIVLLDAAERRTAFLEQAVAELGIGSRVTVVRGRAEELGRDPELRRRFDVVTARSFGPPAVTAE